MSSDPASVPARLPRRNRHPRIWGFTCGWRERHRALWWTGLGSCVSVVMAQAGVLVYWSVPAPASRPGPTVPVAVVSSYRSTAATVPAPVRVGGVHHDGYIQTGDGIEIRPEVIPPGRTATFTAQAPADEAWTAPPTFDEMVWVWVDPSTGRAEDRGAPCTDTVGPDLQTAKIGGWG